MVRSGLLVPAGRSGGRGVVSGGALPTTRRDSRTVTAGVTLCPGQKHDSFRALPAACTRRRLAESILEALEELKPTSVVGVELQEVYMGTVAPQILGIKVRRCNA